jgi:large subunit ribosomal protein L4
MELTIKTYTGGDTGRTITLPESVFGLDPNDHAIYLDVKQYLANQRTGTHKSKQRNEVSGSTRKLIKQKGSGGARHGNIKAPIYVGGGRVFGPVPRDYRFKLNKKLKQVARRSALSYKVKEAAITVVEDFNFEAPKTKDFLKVLSALELAGQKTLLVLTDHTPNVYLSARNLPKTFVMTVQDLNTYAVMNCDRLVLCEGAVAKLSEQLGK